MAVVQGFLQASMLFPVSTSQHIHAVLYVLITLNSYGSRASFIEIFLCDSFKNISEGLGGVGSVFILRNCLFGTAYNVIK